MFVSVTRLRLKGKRKLPLFFWHTFKSVSQSRKSEGLLYSSFNNEGWDTYWTLTMWENKDAMKEYRNKGSHLKAMKVSRNIANELESINWETENKPTWEECKQRLNNKYGRNLVK
jgi:heme-degrading monooxygenase HmoA